ncbi:MFS transporter [Novosphingobium terrae]|uniref:MFS transporter n=1 Tax=Novosphingobium terrae TaxID=2726189 RepID=UPI0019816254|nr:MFS transporter [Novosphingobium terrae]
MYNDLASAAPRPASPDVADSAWDTAYEWRSILLLSLGFALVGFDRYLILPMFPVIMVGLKLDYTDLGTITGALAITWGLSAFVAGQLADRFGRKRTMVAAMMGFSLLVGLSGLAAGALSLILIRALMGIAEGAYAPPSLVATMEAARPDRKGLSLGFYQMASPLLGLAIAPILVTQLMHWIDWRFIFLVASPPGLIVAFLLWRVIREPHAHATPAPTDEVNPTRFGDLLKYRNVGLAALGMLAWLNTIIVLTAFLPSYFVDLLKLPTATMGFIMSSVGFGAVFGSVGLPALSDRLGRKPCAIVAILIVATLLIMLSHTGPNPGLLFGLLMVASGFLSGLISLTAGPLAMESVPVPLRATATGTVIAVGEIFGGGISPMIAGAMAHHFGIAAIFWLAIGGLGVGLIAFLFLHESAPSKTRHAH